MVQQPILTGSCYIPLEGRAKSTQDSSGKIIAWSFATAAGSKGGYDGARHVSPYFYNRPGPKGTAPASDRVAKVWRQHMHDDLAQNGGPNLWPALKYSKNASGLYVASKDDILSKQADYPSASARNSLLASQVASWARCVYYKTPSPPVVSCKTNCTPPPPPGGAAPQLKLVVTVPEAFHASGKYSANTVQAHLELTCSECSGDYGIQDASWTMRITNPSPEYTNQYDPGTLTQTRSDLPHLANIAQGAGTISPEFYRATDAAQPMRLAATSSQEVSFWYYKPGQQTTTTLCDNGTCTTVTNTSPGQVAKDTVTMQIVYEYSDGIVIEPSPDGSVLIPVVGALTTG